VGNLTSNYSNVCIDTNLLNNFMAPKIPRKAPFSSGTKRAFQRATYLNIQITEGHNKNKWKISVS